jgi:quercetin dioxygenase-like cupin family protein
MTLLAEPTVQVDNERVRVTEWRFQPGAATGHHRHAHDYVVVPMTTGRLLLRDAAGERYAELQVGKSYARSEGVEHDVINANDYEFVFVEIELKATPVGSSPSRSNGNESNADDEFASVGNEPK